MIALDATMFWHVLSTARRAGGARRDEQAHGDAVTVLDLSRAGRRARRRSDGLTVVTSQIEEQGPRLSQPVRGNTKRLRRDLLPLLSTRVRSLLRQSY